jgi:HD-GYP domain-containing protein (c-di-GMP phosphodiesterase class II)/tetratricopeptide (TPR) repeat protein
MITLEASPSGETPARATLVEDLLETAYQLCKHDPQGALLLAQEALSSLEGHQNQQAAHTFLFIGKIYYQQAQLSEALSALENAYEQFKQAGDSFLTLESLLELGRVHRDLGHVEKAAESFEYALRLAQETNDPQGEVDAMNLQASVYNSQGKTATALKCLQESLIIAERYQLREQQANILSNIGTLHTSLGNYPSALEALRTAHRWLQEITPNSRSEASNLIHLGHLYMEMNDIAMSRDFFSQAREVGRRMADPLVEATALNNLANLYLDAQSWSLAREGFAEALVIAQKAEVKQLEIDNLDGLGQVHVALGHFGEAIKIHEHVLHIAREIGDSEGEVDALLNLGRDFLADAQPHRALEVLHQGLELIQAAEYQRSKYEVHELLSQSYEKLGEATKALHHYRMFHELQTRVFNEENTRKTRELGIQFELERVHREADEYRLRTELAQQAREVAENKIRERTRELEESQLEIVTRLALAGEYRDDDTGEHTRRVGRNAAVLAYMLGWSEEDVQLIYSAARLHDVGKIGVRDAILLKPGKLTHDEMALMRMHTLMGARILSVGRSRLLQMAEEIAHFHHERWDGKGYPNGLAGATIPLSARIVAVADVLDALTHERPYKRAWSVEEALLEIERQSGQQFDPRIVQVCLRVFGPNGMLSPLHIPPDWPSTYQELRELQ